MTSFNFARFRLSRPNWMYALAIAGPLGLSIGFLGIQNLIGDDDQPPSNEPNLRSTNATIPAGEGSSIAVTASAGSTSPAVVPALSPLAAQPPAVARAPRAASNATPAAPGLDGPVNWSGPVGPNPINPNNMMMPAEQSLFAAGFPGQVNLYSGQNIFSNRRAFDPADQKLHLEAMQLASKLRDRSLGKDESDKLKAELKELLNEQFENRQASRQKELDQLKGEVAKLEKAIDERNKKKDEIVARRLAQLAGESDPLDWEDNANFRMDSSFYYVPSHPWQQEMPRTPSTTNRPSRFYSPGMPSVPGEPSNFNLPTPSGSIPAQPVQPIQPVPAQSGTRTIYYQNSDGQVTTASVPTNSTLPNPTRPFDANELVPGEAVPIDPQPNLTPFRRIIEALRNGREDEAKEMIRRLEAELGQGDALPPSTTSF